VDSGKPSGRTHRWLAIGFGSGFLPPVLAIATKGKYYLRRTDDGIELPMYDEFGKPVGRALEMSMCAITITNGRT